MLFVSQGLLQRMTNCLDLWKCTAAFGTAPLPANFNQLSAQRVWPQWPSSSTMRQTLMTIVAFGGIGQCENLWA
jgi:hypothetical protein